MPKPVRISEMPARDDRVFQRVAEHHPLLVRALGPRGADVVLAAPLPSKSKRNLYYANANIISTAVDGPYMGDAETRWDYLWYLKDSNSFHQ